MADLRLQASDDHVARIAHEGDPVRAVVELVWNAIDAEATNVNVVLKRSLSEAIQEVQVVDDGHGITGDEVASTFGRIGGSWKKLTEKSKNDKRTLHGKLGEGRLRALALGSRVTWASRSTSITGEHEVITISGNRRERDRFVWDRRPASGDERASGTTVTAVNDEQRSLGALEAKDIIATLRAHFAPVLLNDDTLTITYDGSTLDPAEEIMHDTPIAITFGENNSQSATVRIIEWRTGQHRAIYVGPDTDHFQYETSGDSIDKLFSFSAYVTWNGLGHEELGLLGLHEMAPGNVGELWNSVRRAVREHFNTRRRERRREQIEEWRDKGIYPYTSAPTTEAEQAERAVFDAISGTIANQIPKSKREAQLTLNLLKNALHHDPEKLTTILHEVVSLSEDDRDTLTKLLRETTLPAIIRSANLIANRHKFLAGLRHLLFDPNDSGGIGERDHLHKILEHHLWIFGEAYHLMSSERSLTELLRNHLKLEGLPSRDVETVRRWDGKTGRTDLHLAAKASEHDRLRHLIVELKAPDITIGRKEVDQVEDYANAVLSNNAFKSDNAIWDIILVVNDFDDVVRRRIKEEYRSTGLVFEPPHEPGLPQMRVYVRRWSDIIAENQRRLEFVTSALEHDPSIAEGLKYVREEYSDLLPASLQSTTGDEAEAV
ncbi:ATP-binding protein [Nocardia rhamnosiphila]|uniref:ATP-binding protein n=1 Tax=Nocardia rhamnosiphila TaxID=426716 RepID=A0ABV2WZN3_9NOCA